MGGSYFPQSMVSSSFSSENHTSTRSSSFLSGRCRIMNGVGMKLPPVLCCGLGCVLSVSLGVSLVASWPCALRPTLSRGEVESWVRNE